MASAAPHPQPREIYSREFTDPDAYTVANGLVSGNIVGLAPAGFRGRVTRVDLGRIKLRQGEATAPVTMRGGIADLHAFTFATRPAAPRALSGRIVPMQTLFHHRPKEMMFGTSPTGQPWPFATVALPFDVLAQAGGAFAGRAIAPRRDDSALIRTPDAALFRLLSLISDASRLAIEAPEILAMHAPAQALSGAILDALAACLAQGETIRDRAALRRHHEIIARLEQVLIERPEDIFSLADLCAAVGAAERTLHLACQEFYGMGPMQYVRQHRLDRVHAALLMAEPLHDTVAAIAMRYGFWELGRFAGAYRARFGEPPSATLRRPASRRLH